MAIANNAKRLSGFHGIPIDKANPNIKTRMSKLLIKALVFFLFISFSLFFITVVITAKRPHTAI